MSAFDLLLSFQLTVRTFLMCVSALPFGLSSEICINGIPPDRQPSNVKPSTVKLPYCMLMSSWPRLNGSVFVWLIVRFLYSWLS